MEIRLRLPDEARAELLRRARQERRTIRGEAEAIVLAELERKLQEEIQQREGSAEPVPA